MRVTYLELENIKSYTGPTRVELTAGVNAICGLNGSGKTTILEAIGFALFDYLPYTQTAFLREGERSGTIRLGVVGRDDREYEVVRRVGTGAAYFVSDVETETKIADRGPAVLDWIRRQALNLDGEADLGALFKNAVGVPQGLMTSDFQGTATTRKSIFDPLLRVEEYRAAYEYLRDTVSHLKQRSAQVAGEIDALSLEVEAVPIKREESAIRTADVEASRRELVSLDELMRERETQRGSLDEVAERLRDLEGQLRDATYHIEREESFLAEHERQREVSREAARVVARSESGFRLVEAARRALAELERSRAERDKLREVLNTAQTDRRECWGAVQSLDKDRAEADKAAQQAAELSDAVSRQEELEGRLREAQATLHEIPSIDERIAKLKSSVTTLEETVAGRERQLVIAQEAAGRAEELPAVEEELGSVTSKLGELEPLKEQRDEVGRRGSDLKERRIRLIADLRRGDELGGRLETLRPIADRLEDLAGREGALRDRQTWIGAAIEYQELARSELSAGHCPLLELQCPVVSADASALQRFTAREQSLASELREVQASLRTLAPELVGARAAAEESQKLLVEIARLEGTGSELDAVEAELRDCLERYQTLFARVEAEPELTRRRGELHETLQALRAAAARATQIPMIETQLAKDREAFELTRAELLGLEAQRRSLDLLDEEAKRLSDQLGQLDDPRDRQRNLLALAGRKPDIEALLVAEQEKMSEAAGRVKAHLAELQRFEKLDDEMAAQWRVEAEHMGEHEAYLLNQGEATQLKPREEAVAATAEKLRSARQRHAEVVARRDEVADGYDPEQHQALIVECRELCEARARAEATREHREVLLQRVQQDLAYLERQEEKRRARESERARVDRTQRAVQFIRETIKAAGPAITESLLTNISEGANEIFSEIMDDHAAELRWDRDYDVIVQRGTEERKFAQLSGGEQMSAALAIRLALLREMSEVDFAFFDEPTQNMDAERRTNLAGQVRQVRGFDQLIVISHDDTFEHHTDNLIRLRKEYEETVLEA